MDKIRFNPDEYGGLELARAVVLQYLKENHSCHQYNDVISSLDNYVDFIGDFRQGRSRMSMLAQDILWELMIQGVIAPGLNVANPNLPFFHITEYGGKVISEQKYMPHDPTGYLDRFRIEIENADPVITTYLTESLECFVRGNSIASVVMLGIAAERVFLSLCSALHNSLSNPSEKTAFGRVLNRHAMKPKMDWFLDRIQKLQQGSPRPLPDNVNIMLCTIYDFIRCQRNDLGHPQDSLPNVT
ncbi:hypothetical protein ACFLV6_01105 [Chloroflexota bacterium]